jgi:bacteriocin biosynthesis cyclodehydratase domain-containing protein
MSQGRQTDERATGEDDDSASDEHDLSVTYPTFNPSLIPVQVDANTLHIRGGPWSGPILTIHDDEEDGSIARLVELIDGETHVDEILSAFESEQREEVHTALEGLEENQVIYDRAEHADDSLYPHLAMRRRFRERERRRLDEEEVAIVSGSRMGSQIAEDLLEMGIGAIGVLQPTGADRPQLSALTERDRVDAFEPEALSEVVEAADFVVYAADRARPELLDQLNEAAHEAQTPWVSAQILGFDGIVGPAVFPDETACYECFKRRTLANVTNRDGYTTYRDVVAEDDLQTAQLPGLRRAVAGMLSLDLLHLLAYGVGYTAERVVTMNAIDLSMETNRVLKLPRCPVCGKQPGDDQARFVGLEDMVAAEEFGNPTDGGQ